MGERLRRIATITGTVQGVGFRPFVSRLATEERLDGSVHNDGAAVFLDVEGPPSAIERLAARLLSEAPVAARIEHVAWRDEAPSGRRGFVIDASADARGSALPIPPDLATCPACLAEVRDPRERRHRYPFTNCTACGPRYTIVEALPYDRAQTTMRDFALCEACAAEHASPADRRHHAQPIACPRCGPQLSLIDRSGACLASRDAALEGAVAALREGRVLALQGLGGFQLLCDATSVGAVATLRERKHRPEQPLALMVADLERARRLAFVSDDEAAALAGSEAPIVLLRRRAGGPLAANVAPGIDRLGVMLPTTPLHHLLLGSIPFPVVCTSGNLHDEPIAIDREDALGRLASIADLFLTHDRRIARRVDDGVVQVVAGRARVVRLGRGLGPRAFTLAGDGVPRLCVGAHLKNAPAVALEDRVILWPHVGDLDTPRARAAFEESCGDMQRFLRVTVSEVVCDRHPDYASSLFAERLGLPIRAVPHHLAHVAACLAEHGARDALGFSWDGFGLGEGGGAWGGEVLAVGAGSVARRVGHLRAFPLPGGDAAARDGRRALAGLFVAAGWDARLIAIDAEAARFVPLARSPRLSPPTSSVGRLFDAVSALLGVRARSSYEGQAARELEALATPGAPPYPCRLVDGVFDWEPMLGALIEERDDPVRAASRFHATLVAWIAEASRGAPRVALSGGCFSNARLAEGAIDALRERGIEALLPERAPVHDGGLALGQAWLAARSGGA